MKKLIYMLLAFFCSLSLSAAGTENIIPFVSVSASNSDGIMLSGNLVNFSGMSEKSLDATHDDAADGSTMWCSRSGVLGDVKLTFDLKKSYRLQGLYIWNFNRPGNLNKGVKNMRIEYSDDYTNWTELAAPENPGYVVDANYPFQLAQASGIDGLNATNLNDGKNTPIRLSGIQARYVRLQIAKTIGNGNWGGNAFGLSEVLFTTDEEVSDALNVTVDFGKINNTCGNMLFGGCQNPSLPHSRKILPQLTEAGFNCIRCDMWLEKILPSNITYQDYINNVNDVQNPDTWDFSDLELAVRAKKSGMKVMMIIAYCPGWLAYNGTSKGVPMDLDVYADIVRKVYSRYYKYIDWVEVYNEPGYFMTIDKSPYASAGAALADIYMTCVKVVREITPDMPMGGTSVVTHSDGGVGGSTNRDFFADIRINKDNFNFYSHHVYGDYGIPTEQETVTRVKGQLAKFGYGDLPVYFTEWSTSISNAADSVTYIGTKSHLFVGNCLVNWMRDGLAGAMHWNYLQAIAENGTTEQGISADAHGLYAWDVRNKKGRLLPKAYVFRLLSKTLGLGIGENRVVETDYTEAEEYLNVVSLINNNGEACTVIVNKYQYPVKIALFSEADYSKIEKYTVTYTERGMNGAETAFSNKKSLIILAPNSVTGIKYIK
ncbi:cellulase family glycosylhydrolase [Bacteroides sp. K03]|nr:cellulase family glycosylhydrolase [Bacteroides sp. K03]